MITIVYARVSGEDQARTGFSLPSQIEAGRIRAQQNGAQDVLVFSDEGVPGDVLERPGLQGALEVIRRGGITNFICFDPDRLARSLSLQLLVTDQVERAGTKLEFINFEYKNTPEGQLFYSLRGAISQFEKAKIRERTMRGKRQKAKAGGLTHSPNLYGYDFNRETDKLAINEEKAEIIRLIFTWFLKEDVGPWMIAERLSELGVPTNRGASRWHHSSVRNILRNESYTGNYNQQVWDYTDTRNNKYRPKGEKVAPKIRPISDWLPVSIAPIIDQGTYQAAKAKLENARRWWSGWHREVYLLSGLCTCAICKRPIYGASRMSGKSRIRYYVCRGYAPGIPGQDRCAFGRIRADEVEQSVWEEVRTLILEPDRLIVLLNQRVSVSTVEDELDTLRKQMAVIDLEHQRTVRFTVRGTIDEETGDRLLKEQRQQMLRLKEQIAKLEFQSLNAAAIADQTKAIDELRHEVEPVIDQLTIEEQQQVVRAIVQSVELTKEDTFIHVRLNSLR